MFAASTNTYISKRMLEQYTLAKQEQSQKQQQPKLSSKQFNEDNEEGKMDVDQAKPQQMEVTFAN